MKNMRNKDAADKMLDLIDTLVDEHRNTEVFRQHPGKPDEHRNTEVFRQHPGKPMGKYTHITEDSSDNSEMPSNLPIIRMGNDVSQKKSLTKKPEKKFEDVITTDTKYMNEMALINTRLKNAVEKQPIKEIKPIPPVKKPIEILHSDSSEDVSHPKENNDMFIEKYGDDASSESLVKPPKKSRSNSKSNQSKTRSNSRSGSKSNRPRSNSRSGSKTNRHRSNSRSGSQSSRPRSNTRSWSSSKTSHVKSNEEHYEILIIIINFVILIIDLINKILFGVYEYAKQRVGKKDGMRYDNSLDEEEIYD